MMAAAAAERCGRDPCGALCPLLAYLSVGYADYAVLAHVLPQPALRASPWCPIHAVTFNLLVFLLLASHTRAVLADPGVVPLPDTAIDFSDLHPMERNSDEWTVCSHCEAYRPPRAHHCRVCHRCVRRMDQHCPWINNCIGELNQKYFIQFLFYTGLTSAYAAGLVLAAWLGPSGGDGTENRVQTWCPSSRSSPTSGGQRRHVGDEHGQQHCRRCLGGVCLAGSAPAAPHPAPHTASCPTATSEPHRMAGGARGALAPLGVLIPQSLGTPERF